MRLTGWQRQDDSNMKITIYGAGAIGGLVGAYMVRAGEDVLFVDKVTEHVEKQANKTLLRGRLTREAYAYETT